MLKKIFSVLKFKPSIISLLNLILITISGILFVDTRFYRIPKKFIKSVRYQYIEIFIKKSFFHFNVNKDLPIDFVVDLGCSFGLSSIFLRDYFDVPVYAFDAVDNVLFRSERITYRFGLIGDKTGGQYFQRSPNIESSSIQVGGCLDSTCEYLNYIDLTVNFRKGKFFLKSDIEGSEYSLLKVYGRELKNNCIAGFFEFHNVSEVGVLVYKLTSNILRDFDFVVGKCKSGNVELSFIKRSVF